MAFNNDIDDEEIICHKMSPWILSRSRVSGGVAGGVIKDAAEGPVVERVPGADMFKL